MSSLLLPLGQDDVPRYRAPLASIALGAMCVLVFGGTWLQPTNRAGSASATLGQVEQFWAEHPYLKLSPEVVQQLGAERVAEASEKAQPHLWKSQLEEEQAQIDELTREFRQAEDRNLFHRLALVPTRGPLQLGLLTHMFLHAGWLPFLTSLLFLFLLGPLFENSWGRGAFVWVYVLGGGIAAGTQMGLEPSALTPIVGAWGAVATLIGAFALRLLFARAPSRVWGWLILALWVAVELNAYFKGTLLDLAIVGHLASFGFGFAVAAVFRLTRAGERLIEPEEEGKLGWTQHAGVLRGQEALRTGDLLSARLGFEEALRDEPENLDAELGLTRLELDAGEGRGLQRCERLLTRFLTQGDLPHLYEVLQEVGTLVRTSQLRPQISLRTAVALEEGPEGLRFLAERFYAGAGSHPNSAAPRALLRAAELRLESGQDIEEAERYLDELNAQATVPKELQDRAIALRERLDTKRASSRSAPSRFLRRVPSFLEMPMVSAAPTPEGPKIVRGTLLEMADDVLRIQSESGREHSLPLKSVLAIGVGMTPRPTPEAPKRNVVVTDLVVDWGEGGKGPGVLRLESTHLRLARVYPDLPPTEAYRKFLRHVLKQSGASPLSAMDGILAGRYPKYRNESELTATLYGHTAANTAVEVQRPN